MYLIETIHACTKVREKEVSRHAHIHEQGKSMDWVSKVCTQSRSAHKVTGILLAF